MPSEAQSQEPRDRGPAPPVTRAGRSAQLAKAAATRPVPERRTRGRPRKDGCSVQSSPPSPPPPLPKNRKKGRSRNRTQGENEEEVNPTKESATPGTALKEVKETTGRRRSTSRRKSNSNPDPSPDVDVDPELVPLEPSPEPFPGAEVGHSPQSPAPPVSSGDADTLQTGCPPPSFSDLSLVQGGCRLSQSCSPVQMDLESIPSRIPMEEGEATVSVQSSPYSPAFSPPVSPCLRLEDEDSMTLHFQRSLSEDSGGSPTASLGRTQERLKKQCAFCYRGDELTLGQGHLVVFGPTPGYIPLHVLNRRASPDRDDDCHDHCYRGDKVMPTCSSPEHSDQSSSEFIKQVGPIGLPLDVNVQSLFDPTGQCCAHLQCAAWSEGVCRGEGQSLLYVDKAIDSGSTQVCSFCCRLGATLRCKETSCGRSYHFICAAAAGTHQNWNLTHILCTRHSHTGLSLCVLCSGAGGDLLMCCCCGDCYHASCLDPPLIPSPLCRAGWQCPKCRVCQSCRVPGDEGQLLVCERCDKVYHSHCLTPPLDQTPSTGWTCKFCRVCLRCGVRSSGQWANHPSLCVSCDPGLECSVCGGAPDVSQSEKNQICSCCFRSVHTECLDQEGQAKTGSELYVCSTCRLPTLVPSRSTANSTCALSLERPTSPHPGPTEPPESPAHPSDHRHGPNSPKIPSSPFTQSPAGPSDPHYAPNPLEIPHCPPTQRPTGPSEPDDDSKSIEPPHSPHIQSALSPSEPQHASDSMETPQSLHTHSPAGQLDPNHGNDSVETSHHPFTESSASLSDPHHNPDSLETPHSPSPQSPGPSDHNHGPDSVETPNHPSTQSRAGSSDPNQCPDLVETSHRPFAQSSAGLSDPHLSPDSLETPNCPSTQSSAGLSDPHHSFDSLQTPHHNLVSVEIPHSLSTQSPDGLSDPHHSPHSLETHHSPPSQIPAGPSHPNHGPDSMETSYRPSTQSPAPLTDPHRGPDYLKNHHNPSTQILVVLSEQHCGPYSQESHQSPTTQAPAGPTDRRHGPDSMETSHTPPTHSSAGSAYVCHASDSMETSHSPFTHSSAGLLDPNHCPDSLESPHRPHIQSRVGESDLCYGLNSLETPNSPHTQSPAGPSDPHHYLDSMETPHSLHTQSPAGPSEPHHDSHSMETPCAPPTQSLATRSEPLHGPGSLETPQSPLTQSPAHPSDSHHSPPCIEIPHRPSTQSLHGSSDPHHGPESLETIHSPPTQSPVGPSEPHHGPYSLETPHCPPAQNPTGSSDLHCGLDSQETPHNPPAQNLAGPSHPCHGSGSLEISPSPHKCSPAGPSPPHHSHDSMETSHSSHTLSSAGSSDPYHDSQSMETPDLKETLQSLPTQSLACPSDQFQPTDSNGAPFRSPMQSPAASLSPLKSKLCQSLIPLYSGPCEVPQSLDLPDPQCSGCDVAAPVELSESPGPSQTPQGPHSTCHAFSQPQVCHVESPAECLEVQESLPLSLPDEPESQKSSLDPPETRLTLFCPGNPRQSFTPSDPGHLDLQHGSHPGSAASTRLSYTRPHSVLRPHCSRINRWVPETVPRDLQCTPLYQQSAGRNHPPAENISTLEQDLWANTDASSCSAPCSPCDKVVQVHPQQKSQSEPNSPTHFPQTGTISMLLNRDQNCQTLELKHAAASYCPALPPPKGLIHNTLMSADHQSPPGSLTDHTEGLPVPPSTCSQSPSHTRTTSLCHLATPVQSAVQGPEESHSPALDPGSPSSGSCPPHSTLMDQTRQTLSNSAHSATSVLSPTCGPAQGTETSTFSTPIQHCGVPTMAQQDPGFLPDGALISAAQMSPNCLICHSTSHLDPDMSSSILHKPASLSCRPRKPSSPEEVLSLEQDLSHVHSVQSNSLPYPDGPAQASSSCEPQVHPSPRCSRPDSPPSCSGAAGPAVNLHSPVQQGLSPGLRPESDLSMYCEVIGKDCGPAVRGLCEGRTQGPESLGPGSESSGPTPESLCDRGCYHQEHKQTETPSCGTLLHTDFNSGEAEEERHLSGEVEEQQRLSGEVEEERRLSGEVEEEQQGLSGEVEEEHRLSGEVEEERRLSGEVEEERRLSGEVEEERRLSGEVEEERRLSGEVEEERRLSGEVEEERRLSGEVEEERRLSGEVEEERRLSGEVEEERRLSGEVEEERRLSGEVEEERRLSGEVEEERRLSGEVEEQQGVTGEVEEQQGVTGEVEEQQGLMGEVEEQQGLMGEVEEQHGLMGEGEEQHGLMGEVEEERRLSGEVEEQHGLMGEVEEQQGLPEEVDEEQHHLPEEVEEQQELQQHLPEKEEEEEQQQHLPEKEEEQHVQEEEGEALERQQSPVAREDKETVMRKELNEGVSPAQAASPLTHSPLSLFSPPPAVASLVSQPSSPRSGTPSPLSQPHSTPPSASPIPKPSSPPLVNPSPRSQPPLSLQSIIPSFCQTLSPSSPTASHLSQSLSPPASPNPVPRPPPPPTISVLSQYTSLRLHLHNKAADETSSCHATTDVNDSQSLSLLECIALATKPTKDTRQSHAKPSLEEEESVVVPAQQPLREGNQQPLGENQEEEPVSPVLDLDSSLDLEVMDLMGSPPPTALLHLSSPSPPMRRILRPPPRSPSPRPPLWSSSKPSDDLSLRLRMSPFSAEASPETSPTRTPAPPPPLSPPSPPLRESPPPSKLLVHPPLLLPLMPKIGMGKPAITKRKFSPGRVRLSRQGSWWSNGPSPSQDSTGEAGWDSPKPRPADSPLWSMRVGRGSGFPGRRRSRGGGAGTGRGGRGRSRPKTQESPTVCTGGTYVEPFQVKEEEESSMHNTVVMFSTSDHFTLKQDMCVVCGSFGQGAEGRLLACFQCGQCYHPYCVNVKITRVVLTKGWRCLECTVCEACGKASDPGRLLLCDDCDISYHTYCLDPPLHTVPKGAWKCKWCVWCVQCGSTSPGLHCEWQSNYSRCGPCHSLNRCPLCQRVYSQDELVLQCQQCDRWVHASCQGLSSENEVEFAADAGFDCTLCQAHSHSSQGRADPLGPFMAQIVSRARETETKTYTQDGVCLTESGLSHLQSLVEPLTSPRRYRRCKPKLKLRIINQNSVSVLQTPESELQPDPCRGEQEYEMKSDSSPERDPTHNDNIAKEPEVTDCNKKRKRKPYRPGIGGFMVRQRGGKSGQSRIKLCRRISTEMLPGQSEGLLDADISMETVVSGEQTTEKVKKRYRKKKTKLEEAFPSYLQDAFFGRDLLDRSRHLDRRVGSDAPASQSGFQATCPSGPQAVTTATSAERRPRKLPMSGDALVDLSSVINTEPSLLSSGVSGQFQVERSPSPFAGIDISSVSSEVTGEGGRDRPRHDEPLDVILSPELDKMVSDGDILSKLYKIPELEGKDVEEVFTAVLSPNSSNNQSEQSQHTHNTALLCHPLPLNGLVPPPAAPEMHGGAGLFRAPPPLQGSEPPDGSSSANQASERYSEHDTRALAQRGVFKWEKEESLGEQATVAPVLYCNTNFPQLKEQYPDISIRMKQIAKLWRKASAQDRAPYVQKARDNRAAQRISKVTTTEPLKRPAQIPLQKPLQTPLQTPLQSPLQALPIFDPASTDPDLTFKDPLRPRESEQEQEWKFRQQMRQKSKQLAKLEACQKLEAVKNEQLQQRQRGRLSPETSPSIQHQPLPSPRASSPWDPYRPTSSHPGGASGHQQNSLSTSSPLHEVLASTHSLESKSTETCRDTQPGVQHTSSMINSNSGFRPVETFQKMSAQLVSRVESYLSPGGVFKAPMPPTQPLQQEVLGSTLAGRRDPCKSSDLDLDPTHLTTPSAAHPEPYLSAPGTPRPPNQSPGTISPMGLGPSVDQSPVRPQVFHRTPTSPTPKHARSSEDSLTASSSRIPFHDPFEPAHRTTSHQTPGHQTPGPQTPDKTANDMSSLDRPISILPQVGDSEEKLQQRQRLRQLILRQQQQKKEAGPPGSSLTVTSGPVPPGPGSTVPLQNWTQLDSAPSAQPVDPFARPPPPYPGVPILSFPRQTLPRTQRLVAPLGQQDFLRPSQGIVPAPALVQMRPEFTGIRPPPVTTPHLLSGHAQPFLPRSLPLQQHSIMGRPYIELRHRLRMPLPVAPSTVTRTSVRVSIVEQQVQQNHQYHQRATMASGAEPLLPGAQGMEEHLEDSAVKDLEDVEVKDLVDLNLNLDPEDGKEDLDLHLDDFLLSGKFDLIAYADPELDLEDKKDMFNEELDLGESADERKAEGPGSPRKSENYPMWQVTPDTNLRPPGALRPHEPVETAGSAGTTGPAGLLTKTQEQTQPSGLVQDQSTMSGGLSSFQQSPFDLSLTSSTPLTSPPTGILLDPRSSPQNQNKSRPLLLEEQPLLLQDLLDQERQEQQQQKQMQALIRDKASPDPTGFPNMDPIMNAKMVALKGINKVMSQGSLSLNRFQQTPVAAGTLEGPPPPALMLGQDVKVPPQLIRPLPPSFGTSFVNESQRRQYEEWLGETRRLLQMQQGLLEEQIAAHRKARKALSAKQRTAKRAGRVIPEEDAAQLRSISEQQGVVQKQLEQIRKQQKDHAELIEDYRSKQQQRALQQPLAPPTHLTQPVLAQTTHQAPPSPQAHLAPPSPQTHLAPQSPQTCLTTPTHLAPQSPQTRLTTPIHLAPRSPQTHLAPPSPQTRITTPIHLAPPSPQTHLAPPSPQTRITTPIHLAPPSPQTHLTTPTHLPQPSPQTHLTPPSPQTHLTTPNLLAQPSPQAQLAPPSPQTHMTTPTHLTPPSPHSHLAPSSPQTHLPTSTRGSHPGTHVPVWIPGMIGQKAVSSNNPAPPSVAIEGNASKPQVKFDDNNPFSEGFQERERRERLREQQEKQRVQLMQEVERHRALQQRLDKEQQALLGSGATSATRVGQAPKPGPAGHSPVPQGDSLTQIPFFSSELPQDFLQSLPVQVGALFPHQPGLHVGLTGGSRHPGPRPVPVPVVTLGSRPRPPTQGPAGPIPSHPGSRQCGLESSSSCQSYTGPAPSRGPSSLLQLYSDVIPEDKSKKMRSRRRDIEDPESLCDDVTALPTSRLTPTRTMDQSEASSLFELAPSSELERQLSFVITDQPRASALATDAQRGPLQVKEECEEGGACGGEVKMEEASSSSPLQGSDGGKELLRHLLKDKMSPPTTPLPTAQAPPTSSYQLSTEDNRTSPHSNMGLTESPDTKKRPQRCKRPGRSDHDRAPPKHKRRKKEEEEETLLSIPSSNPPKRQLSVLPLMEPVLGVDLGLFPPYGSSFLGRDSRLSGSFGNGSLNGVTDFYSHLIYKNNLSNPPTPPASLPPTPPPVARQKLLNGFATTDELKDVSEHDVKAVTALKHKGEELLTLTQTSKTVDVPASLPTPPHNIQEDLRGQDSLDSFIPSSSPESLADAEISRYPDVSSIKLEMFLPCPSPTFPLTPCAWGKGTAVKQEVKTEPNFQASSSRSTTDLVTIAITLNPVASQNVPGVMAAVTQLLRISVPPEYQLCPGGPNSSMVNQSSTDCRLQRPGVARMNSIQHGGAAQQCSFCKVPLGNGVRIIRELKQEAPHRKGPGLVFCSPSCSEAQRSVDSRLMSHDQQSHEHCSIPVMTSGTESSPPGVQHHYSNNMSSIPVHSLPHTPPLSSSSSPPLSFPTASAVTMETKPRVDSLKVKVKLKPLPRTVPSGDNLVSSRYLKRAKSPRWKRWSVSISLSRGPCVPNEAVTMPTEEEVDVLLQKLGACLRPEPLPRDERRCCFCHQQGDGETDGPARLLNLDLDLWVHLNCALWSSEVYETQAGALINVELALRRGLTLRCVHCQRPGATSGCNRLRCTNTYHFTCALQASCTFFKDKTMLCHLHKPRSGSVSCSSPSSTPSLTSDLGAASSDPYNSELRCFAVFRRVFVQRDEARQIAAVVQRGERQHTFRVGGLLFRAVGRLLPQQMSSFHNQSAIFPVGYHANRIYWSMRHSNRRCKYMCYIEEKDGRPLFKVKVVERGYEDLVLMGDTPKAVWDQVLEPLALLRSKSGTLKLFPVYLKGEDLFGLTSSAVTRIIESLPGVEACDCYRFRFGRNPLMEWPLAFNPSGSARSEPKACHNKRPFLLTSVAPRCQGSVGSIVGLVPGVVSLSPGDSITAAHQGRHSKSSQYRRMKSEWKSNVYLARSRIQGLGLYAARDIEKCTMVIEYIGTIIRSEVANRKERLYESQNRGVYMFRIDNDFVIDATITGGPARYINHSCAPNCITEVVTVEKENKIIISSCRRIQRGEELSYDYKFDLEDDQHKIPCHCGAVNCRKWMN